MESKEIHEGYLVYEDGRVYSKKSSKFLSQVLDGKKNYLKVAISIDGKMKYPNVHRLVAQAFISNPDNKPQVNHIDCNKTNNHVSNLEWVTNKENYAHAKKHGLVCPPPLAMKGKFGSDHNRSKGVHEIFVETGDIIMSWGSQSECARHYGLSISTIQKRIKNQSIISGFQFVDKATFIDPFN